MLLAWEDVMDDVGADPAVDAGRFRAEQQS